METINAMIQDAKIHKISDLWSRKPRGLKFNDTDALVITLRAQDGSTIKETFYFCLKPDGTFNVNTVSKDGSRVRRQRLASFLKHYKITDKVDEYNLREGVKKWKGIQVAAIKVGDSGSIYVP
ncbi:MAG: hypothetical protein QMD13_06255 [Candidatus Bathyarchaeia archaeon]|nr:hypothetical protein [Candidatus Bathyarchaeia archaeon]